MAAPRLPEISQAPGDALGQKDHDQHEDGTEDEHLVILEHHQQLR